MTAQFPAKRVTNLGNELDFGRMIEFSILEFVHAVLVIDRVSGKMDQVGRVIAE